MSFREHINAYCRKHNIRQVGKRIVIADHLMALGDKVDGDILWRSLRKSEIKVSLATVYYTLNWLVEAGFIEKELTKDRRNVFAVKNRP